MRVRREKLVVLMGPREHLWFKEALGEQLGRHLGKSPGSNGALRGRGA